MTAPLIRRETGVQYRRRCAAVRSARLAWEALAAQWQSILQAHGFADEWAAFRVPDDQWPAPVAAAWRDQIEALHRFYGLRDGPGGVLGGRA